MKRSELNKKLANFRNKISQNGRPTFSQRKPRKTNVKKTIDTYWVGDYGYGKFLLTTTQEKYIGPPKVIYASSSDELTDGPRTKIGMKALQPDFDVLWNGKVRSIIEPSERIVYRNPNTGRNRITERFWVGKNESVKNININQIY